MLNRCAAIGMRGLWIRAAYMEGFQNQSITAVVRSGDRTDPKNFKYIPEGEDIPVRFIKRPGSGQDVSPELYPDDGTTIRRVEAIVKWICELTRVDLFGTTPDTATPELVRYHLALVNNTTPPSFGDIVTIWRFEYRPKVTNA